MYAPSAVRTKTVPSAATRPHVGSLTHHPLTRIEFTVTGSAGAPSVPPPLMPFAAIACSTSIPAVTFPNGVYAGGSGYRRYEL